jgi:molybdopterin synthase catalytic subunit
VDRLDYEAYAEMATERMAKIARAALQRHGLCAAAVEHRVGRVPLTEPSVVVAASSPHRGEAFAGAREIIDRVKAEAPIWKKEVEGADERWVEGSSPRSER